MLNETFSVIFKPSGTVRNLVLYYSTSSSGKSYAKSAAGKGDFQRVGKKWKHTPWAKYLTRTSIEIFDHKKVRFGKNSRNDQSLKKENKILCVFFLPSEFLSRSAIPSCPINQGWPPKMVHDDLSQNS